MGRFKELDIERQENDIDNRKFYNRMHYGTPELDDTCFECEQKECECDEDDNDDTLIGDNY